MKNNNYFVLGSVKSPTTKTGATKAERDAVKDQFANTGKATLPEGFGESSKPPMLLIVGGVVVLALLLRSKK